MEIRSRLSAHRAKPSPCLPFSWVGGKKHRHFVSITKLPGFVSWLYSRRLGVCSGGKLLPQHSRYSNKGVSTIGVICPNGYRKSNQRLGVHLAWHAQQHRKQAMMHCIPIIPTSEVQGHPLIHSKFEESLRYMRPNLITKQKQKLKSHIKAHTLIMGDFNTPLSPLNRSARQKLNREIKE